MRLLIQSFCVLSVYAYCAALAGTPADSNSLAISLAQTLEEVEELRYQGEYEAGIQLASKALEDAASIASPELEVEAIYQLSLLYYYQHDYAKARAEMQVGLARARVHELEKLEADFLAAEGVLEWKQGNLHLALPKLQGAMHIQEQRDNFISMASISNNIGIIYFTLKEFEDAEFYYREGLKLLEKEANERLESSLYINLSEVLIAMSRLDEAAPYLQQALQLEEKLKDPQSLAYIHFNLGELAGRKGDAVTAMDEFRQALRLQEQIGDKWAIILTRLRMSAQLLATDQLEAALKQAKAGYDLAMKVNALSLLRDYSDHFIKLYGALGEDAYIPFFTDQRDWLDQRVSLQQSTEETEITVPESLPDEAAGKQDRFPLQIVIITMLGAMILVLVLENTRLRLRYRRS